MASGLLKELTRFWSGSGFHTADFLELPSAPGVTGSLIDAKAQLERLLSERRRKNVNNQLLDIVQSPNNLEGVRDRLVNVAESLTILKARKPTFDFMEKYEFDTSRPIGIMTGVKGIDSVTNGLMYGTVTVPFGYVGHCKSSFAINCAHTAATNGFTTCFITLEIPREYVKAQLLSLHSYKAAKRLGGSPVPYVKMRQGTLDQNQKNYLKNVVQPDFDNLRGSVYIVELCDLQDDLRLPSLLSYLNAMDKFVDMVVLDYVQLATLTLDESKYNLSRAEGKFVNDFKDLAIGRGKNDQRIVMLLSQANREGYKEAKGETQGKKKDRDAENEGTYSLYALAEVNNLERVASYAFSFYYEGGLRSSEEVKFQVLKNRTGVLIQKPEVTRFKPEFCCMGDMADVKGSVVGGLGAIKTGMTNGFGGFDASKLVT